jgi:hypothetical protein
MAMLPMKTPGTMPLHVQKEMTRISEMNDKIFGLQLNVRDISRNLIGLISLH